jgi:glycosyltransferase involved in cell wall biosynthesis
MSDSLGVITVTRQRPHLLRRAMASVHAQDYPGPIDHLIVADDDPEAAGVVDSAPTRPGLRLSMRLVERPHDEVDETPGDRRRVYPRLARLLNEGVRACDTNWVSILDDDNAYEPNHLSSLLQCAKTNGAVAAHSGRQLLWADGEPFLDEMWHTVKDPTESHRIYNLMCDRGLRVRGTNILLDRADPASAVEKLRASSVARPEDPVFLVDQNVWLIRRDVLLAHPVPEDFDDEDYATNTAPDDKLLARLLVNGIRLFPTGLPTVQYYLGGISNRRHRPGS